MEEKTINTTLAHETGHACGLRDIYPFVRNNTNVIICDIFNAGVVQAGYMNPKDWGAGYYQRDLLHTNLITRLLMYGYGSADDIRGHIPHGSVYGAYYPRGSNLPVTGMSEVGLNSITNRQPIHANRP